MSDAGSWHDPNERYLAAHLALVRAAMRCAAGDTAGAADAEDGARSQMRDAQQELPAPAALDRVCAVFDLSPLERAVLLLCAAAELDPDFSQLCAAIDQSAAARNPTFALAMRLFSEADWRALSPVSSLRYWRLIEVSAHDRLVDSAMRIDERVLHYLKGISYLDARLAATMDLIVSERPAPPTYRRASERIARCWSRAGGTQASIQLVGSDAGACRAVAALGCATAGVQLHRLRAADIPAGAAERSALARLWRREAILGNSALLIECADTSAANTAAAFAEQAGPMMIFAGSEPTAPGRPLMRVDIGPLNAAEQQALWRSALGPAARRLNGELGALTSQFNLDGAAIQAAGLQVRVEGRNGSASIAERVWAAGRMQARGRLDELALRVASNARFADLVLPEPLMRSIGDIVTHVRHRARVYEDWGFAAKSSRGLGITAMFAGPSGTGKTLAAEVVANELGLDLYCIDLSQVVSKFIGETEKNLRRVFDAAQDSGAVLLFDEADALFGKRSDIKDSHDRYANIEISYLLQRMEAYRGLAILTTNMKGLLDAAFLRRLRFVLQFPFPDAGQRAAIWRQVFPSGAPTEGLDVDRLAQLNVTGGSIQNIALQASFFAAGSGGPIRMHHLLQATRNECIKLEKPLSPQETRGWA